MHASKRSDSPVWIAFMSGIWSIGHRSMAIPDIDEGHDFNISTASEIRCFFHSAVLSLRAWHTLSTKEERRWRQAAEGLGADTVIAVFTKPLSSMACLVCG
jgi:hypothetical protein